MSNFIITTDSVTVMADFLEKDKPWRLDLVHVANTEPKEQYVHCVSKNTQLPRLIVEEKFIRRFGSAQKALLRTDILKQLKALKDIEWRKRWMVSAGIQGKSKVVTPEGTSGPRSWPSTRLSRFSLRKYRPSKVLH